MIITDRRKEYETRKRDFVKEFSQHMDLGYAAYYGIEEATYIDARASFYWYLAQDDDQQGIDELLKELSNLPALDKNQAF